jgi:hypothetical protein
MELSVIIGIIVGLLALSFFRISIFIWLVIWPLVVYILIRFGMTVYVPTSMLSLYISLTFVGVVAYVLADKNHYETITQGLYHFVVEKKHSKTLYATIVLIPCAVAAQIYFNMSAEVRAPSFGRTIHPAPPNTITFKDKTIDLLQVRNPYRIFETTDSNLFRQHVENGKRVYYQNCVFCHGDDLAGDGIFAHGFNPVPANFNSPTTIAMLQEGYLFWRIAKGAPGLPEESSPWSSSMPAWEGILSEEEIWDVILFLYDYVGFKPREEEDVH